MFKSRTPTLVPVTDQARLALRDRGEVRLTKFPFKVGRESRQEPAEGLRGELERRLRLTPDLNTLYLLEPNSETMQISREHFTIDYRGGGYVLIDRGSACGTMVGEVAVGGDRKGGQTGLRDGDLIKVGRGSSPYVYRFVAP